MWPFDFTLDRATRQEAIDRARYAIKVHGQDAETYLTAKLETPGRSRRGQAILRLALRELARLRRTEFPDLLDSASG